MNRAALVSVLCNAIPIIFAVILPTWFHDNHYVTKLFTTEFNFVPSLGSPRILGSQDLEEYFVTTSPISTLSGRLIYCYRLHIDLVWKTIYYYKLHKAAYAKAKMGALCETAAKALRNLRETKNHVIC